MPISNMTLMKIAAIGGFVTASMGFALRAKLNDRIAQTEYYKDALQTLRTHPGAVYLLGEPIKAGAIDVSDEKNFTHHLSAHYEVPVRGTKQKGVLHFWADRKDTEDHWNVSRMELELKNEPTRRLLVKGEKQNNSQNVNL
ncbi:hypothetical protein ILUMI_05464 [Ignelater luminosus]|uniref:Cytochrome oxidase complex assembly protein 1 n=1 Tax=Ignelater luminosus TaxID=2038154 RepID=A0A8K0DCH9_IGNLU|nr:hypothetical protein ILUMI_05464 [Ignelater luminosus]